MKKLIHFFFIVLSVGVFSQESNWFYATLTKQDAENLQLNNPDGISILSSSDKISAVYISDQTASKLKDNGNLHGPGYVFRKSQDAALRALDLPIGNSSRILSFDITENDYVNTCIGQVIEGNIAQTIQNLESYGTRFNTKPTGVQASLDIKENWQNMVNAASRSDITVEIFDHDFTQQKSVILTIPGSQNPDEIVIIGGHLDSGDFTLQDDAPGADDNASGIATLTETLRILLTNNFHPLKTVQIMAYAAEEVGLLGSADIANSYLAENKNVLGVLQFDMTNYNESDYDISLISDPDYTSSELNLFLIDLMEHYNASGEHQISYGSSNCGYACSDHASWTENGYLASFPFESEFDEHNPFIHSPGDTFENMGNSASHSTKFVKLALEFVIESAKTQVMSTDEVANIDFKIAVEGKRLIYRFRNNNDLSSITILDSSARRLIQNSVQNSSGSLSLEKLPKGIYIAIFKDVKGKNYSKKFILN